MFVFHITIVSTINCLIYNGFIDGTLFQVAVYYFTFALINSYGKRIELRKMLIILDKMFVLQLITSVIEIAIIVSWVIRLKEHLYQRII